MFEMITSHYVEVVAILLFGIGLSLLIFHVNLIKKIMGLNIMDTGVYLFLASMGYINGGNAPIFAVWETGAVVSFNALVLCRSRNIIIKQQL